METIESPTVGNLLRDWRQRRHLSQLALASDAGISSRHLSFLETGRSSPSREMILLLAECLKVPLRDRNLLLTASGFAPVFSERPLSAAELGAARKAVDTILTGHEPYPALAIDRHWTLLAANAAVPRLLAGVATNLLQPPVNVLRLTLHPDGLASRIANFVEWRSHLLERLRRQIELTADKVLTALREELSGYPIPSEAQPARWKDTRAYADVVVPFELVTEHGLLALISTTTVFGTPIDVTLSELALETFFPANEETSEALHRLARRK